MRGVSMTWPGNIWEWVTDWYDKDYYSTLPSDKPADDPRGPDQGTGLRALRGGSFANDSRLLRTANRNGNAPGYGYVSFGFRCLREVAR